MRLRTVQGSNRPLLFFKRLSDGYEDELARLAAEFSDAAFARELVEEDHTLVRFYLPAEYTWSEVRKNPIGLGEKLTDAMRAVVRENPKLAGVLYNLSPSRYVSSDDQEPPLPLEEVLVLLAEAEEERAEADLELERVLSALGFTGWRRTP
ncbi:MAG: type I restriction-modification system subunit M N-terminal domain-containing protein [Candidatus Promineifilaceae bacterium]